MRHFLCTYSSENNVFKGEMYVGAPTISAAQDKFLEWLKEQPVYAHLWTFTFAFTELKGAL